jgi:hypothetical protein
MVGAAGSNQIANVDTTGLSFDASTNLLSVLGNITSGGNIAAGNMTTAALTATGAVLFSGSITFTSASFTRSATTQNWVDNAMTSGSWTVGGASQTGAINLGRSTRTQIVAIANGITAAANTKTIGIGENGAAASTTTISIGPGLGNGTVTFGSNTTVNISNTSGTALSVAGNITGGNISTAGIVTVNSGGAATAIVNGAANLSGNIGSATGYFNRVFAQATTALYADLAEMYTTDAEYTPGTVMIFGGNQEVTINSESHDYRVAGVVSTNPAHIMNSGLQGEFTVAVALAGRVPVSVIGNITAGDRVVTSNRTGVAEALDMAKYQPGVIIGKALQSHSGNGVGVIEVVVGRL